ncbi:MAG: ABC transporter permease [Dehalococcoidia bacterium]|jgi:putative ABC transport system permease protein|nr:ABC transporter permease [Dehalococcoidia bacterium]
MARLPGFRRMFRFPWRTRTQIERDVETELGFHLDMRTEELVEGGMTPTAARREALRQFGDLDDTKRYCRTVDGAAEQTTRRTMYLDELRQDLRYAVRGFVAHPGFTAVALVTLALGIGANTAMFSAVNALLIRQMPVAEPQDLVDVHRGSLRSGPGFDSWAYPDFVAMRDASRSFAGMYAYTAISTRATFDGEPLRLGGEIVSGSYFDVLGVVPMLGRGFLPDEDVTPGTHPVAVISHGLWQRVLAGAEDVIGRTVLLNEVTFTIVGVAPAGFRSASLGQSSDLWVPMAMQTVMRRPSAGLQRALGTDDLLNAVGASWLRMTARLAPETTRARAEAELDVIMAERTEVFPEAGPTRRAFLTGHNGGNQLRRTLGGIFLLLSGITVLVLLIACANIANLLLARATTRAREIAIRLALGVSRTRLVRQLLTESLVLAVAGGTIGVGIAWWSLGLLESPGLPAMFRPILAAVDVEIDGRVLAYTAALSLLTGIVFGLVPALQSSRSDCVGAIKDAGSGGVDTARGTARLRQLFVLAQVAVSFVLVIATGLMLQTFNNLRAADPGFGVDNQLLADVSLDLPRYSQETGWLFYSRLKQELEALPGVESVSMARVASLSGASRRYGITIEGTEPDEPYEVRANVVGTDYLQTMGIPLEDGRQFGAADRVGAPGVAIVSAAMADRFWPGESPIGRRFVQGNEPVEVIGVARDTRWVSLRSSDEPSYFRPLTQLYESGVTVHLRTAGDPAALASAVRTTVQRLEPALPVSNIRTMNAQFDAALAQERLTATLVTIFGVLAAVLALVGIYGVIAYAVTQRTHEIGVRLALGADRGTIFGLIVRHGMTLVVAGTVIGAAGALAVTRLLSGLLFGVSPTDPGTFVAVAGLFGLAASLACVVPARQAMRVDPIAALRCE